MRRTVVSIRNFSVAWNGAGILDLFYIGRTSIGIVHMCICCNDAALPLSLGEQLFLLARMENTLCANASSQPVVVAVSWCSLSPRYPTSLNRPIISPTVKKPRTSAPITPAEASCLRSRLRILLSIPSGVAALEVVVWVNRLAGCRTALMRG